MEPTDDTQSGNGGPLRALRHYNFRLFWGGQLFSMIGTWMQGLAQSWLIVILADPQAAHMVLATGDATAAIQHTSAAVQATANRYSGLVNFWGGLPVLLFTLFAGVIIDKVNKRWMLLATQTGYMLCAFTLGLLIKLGIVQISEVMAISLMVGVFMVFDMPTRQSFVIEMVGRKDMPSAVAMNSSMFNSARAIGPAVAGLLLASHVSLSTCFFLNSASYLIVIAGILLLRGKTLGDPVPRDTNAPKERLIDDLKAGLNYVWNTHTTRNIVMLVSALGLFAFSFNVLIPTFVRYDLLPHETNAYQVKAFGFLETVRGVGALFAAVMIAFVSRTDRYKFLLIAGSVISNALLMLFAFERHLALAYLTMAVVTFGFVLIFASANTMIQLTVPDALRGRVMSIYMLVFIGTGPLGSLLAGYLAQYIGATWTIFSFAALTLAIVLFLTLMPDGLLTINIGDQPERPVAIGNKVAEGT